MYMKLFLFCEDTGFSKKNVPLWVDICDALHKLRTHTGSVNIKDFDNQKTLSIHSDGMHFLLSLIECMDDETKIKNIQNACFSRVERPVLPVSWRRSHEVTNDFDFVTEVTRKIFITGQA
ncbi:hypothetical protein K5E19_20445 [Enterobacter sp. RIT637]|uniref:DUF6911 family protein n=1 Tax=Enterobacter sp. RIT637 TaxID=2870470 RepID=UPI001C8804CF|nr:hypothetical protein [Enterobacter sp. RIT637]MBX8462815.1 hypothetical protein [Enterobacter sp. RIT637]